MREHAKRTERARERERDREKEREREKEKGKKEKEKEREREREREKASEREREREREKEREFVKRCKGKNVGIFCRTKKGSVCVSLFVCVALPRSYLSVFVILQ